MQTTPATATGSLRRARVTRALLWISVIAWGVLLGAKVFDLLVLAGAWGAAPPESLQRLPYGPHYPVNTGDFFIPPSAALLLATWGAVASGWKTPARYRGWLLLSALMILAVLVFTVTVFWPLNAALWAVATHAPGALHDPAQVQALVDNWRRNDGWRIAAACVGLVASLRAISLPYPPERPTANASLPRKLLYAACGLALLGFVLYFVSELL